MSDAGNNIPYYIPDFTVEGDTSGSSFDWSKLIGTIGSTFASTYNAVNNPMPSGGSYPPPTSSYGASNPPTDTASSASGMSSLFQSPNVYYVMGGAVLLAIVLMKKGGD